MKTKPARNTIVPIGGIAVGDPPVILPPEKHDEIWSVQRPLNLPGFVYGVSRSATEEKMPAMTEITRRRSEALRRHRHDSAVG